MYVGVVAMVFAIAAIHNVKFPSEEKVINAILMKASVLASVLGHPVHRPGYIHHHQGTQLGQGFG